MTEKEWLKCDEPESLWVFLDDRGDINNRKLRLFGCACVRDLWNDLPDDALRQAILTCEQFVEGLATPEELETARALAYDTRGDGGDSIAAHSAIAISELCHALPSFPMGEGSSAGISAVAAEVRSDQHTPWHVARRQAKQLHCRLFREVFGNPFRPVTVDKIWLTSDVLALGRGIYEERAFDRMPILADALQDAGCDNEDILNHLRDPNAVGGQGAKAPRTPHVRGCWALDLVLGKS